MKTQKLRFKQLIAFVLAGLIACCLLTAGKTAYAEEETEDYGPEITAQTYCVIDGNTGAVLLSKAKDQRMYPASCTKVMTALLVLENVEDLDRKVTFTESAVDIDINSSTLEPKAMAGETMTVKDILYGMLLKSGNECGKMLGEVVAGSEEAFAEMMNARAAEIGCVNTHFVNAYGIHDDEHYTTAYDLCLILQEAMKNERYRELNATVNYTIPATNMASAREITMGHAMLNGTVEEEGVIGGKTGSTPQAGKVLVTAVERDGLYTVSALMGSTQECWYTDEQILLEYTYGLYDGSLPPIEWTQTDDIVTATDNVRIRTSPSVYGTAVNAAASGTRVQRVAVYGDWSKIVLNGQIRYAASEFLESLEPEKVPEEKEWDPAWYRTTFDPEEAEETESSTDSETETGEKSGTGQETDPTGTEKTGSETGTEESVKEKASAAAAGFKEKIEALFGKVRSFFESLTMTEFLVVIGAGVLIIAALIFIIVMMVRNHAKRSRRNRLKRKNRTDT